MAGFAVPSRDRWAHAVKLPVVIGSEPMIVAWAEPGRDDHGAVVAGARPAASALMRMPSAISSVGGHGPPSAPTSSRTPGGQPAVARCVLSCQAAGALNWMVTAGISARSHSPAHDAHRGDRITVHSYRCTHRSWFS